MPVVKGVKYSYDKKGREKAKKAKKQEKDRKKMKKNTNKK